MTNPFKVGDRVVCVSGARGLKTGDECIIAHANQWDVRIDGFGLFHYDRFTHAKLEPITDTCIMPSAPELVEGPHDDLTEAALRTDLDRWIRQSQHLETLNAELTTKLENAEKWEADTSKTLQGVMALIAKQALRIAELEAMAANERKWGFGDD